MYNYIKYCKEVLENKHLFFLPFCVSIVKPTAVIFQIRDTTQAISQKTCDQKLSHAMPSKYTFYKLIFNKRSLKIRRHHHRKSKIICTFTMPLMAFLFFLFPTMRKHKFLTKEILNDFHKIWEQRNIADPIIVCKYFDPCSQWTWYATEYDKRGNVCFGFVIWIEEERGYFSLDKLAEYKWPLGIGIERDAHFTKCRFSILQKKLGL